MSRLLMQDEPIVVTATASTTGRCPFEGVASAVVYVPAGSSITELTFFHDHKLTPGSAALTRSTVATADDANATITLTVAAGRDTIMPTSLFPCANLAIKGNAAGTIYVTAKS